MLSPSDKILANLILQLLWSYLDCDFCGAAAPLASGLAWNFQISKSDDNAFANLCWEVHECLVYKDITYQLPHDRAFPKTISNSFCSPPHPTTHPPLADKSVWYWTGERLMALHLS